LTDIGVPAIAYRESVKRGWKTIGIACEKANEYKQFSCDQKIIIGKEWGDESDEFISMIDILVKIGGGKQSTEECKKAKAKGIKVIEYDLT
jgi:hypothetical protein